MSYFNFCYRDNNNKTVSITSKGRTLGVVIDDFTAFLKACGFKMDNLTLTLENTSLEENPEVPKNIKFFSKEPQLPMEGL